MMTYFVAQKFSCLSSFYSRGWRCAQQLVLSYTKELRKSQQPFWKGEVWMQETMWCYCILQVPKCQFTHVWFLSLIAKWKSYLHFNVSGVFATIISVGVDLIAAFYGCLYAGVIPVTVRPPHPQNLAATLPTVRMIIDVSAWNRNTSEQSEHNPPPTNSCLTYRWVKQPASLPLSLSWESSGPGKLLPASTSRPGPLSLIQVPEPLFKLEQWKNYLCLVSFYCFFNTFERSAKCLNKLSFWPQGVVVCLFNFLQQLRPFQM